ncbi:Arc family DNA-binding protein [Mesorhizobium sp. M0870]|uniref:Arc family DNA-binding protein n=1 Tax=Mesorhizobium sp. M0870 TaxID=2957016 RepID=UPI00333E115B
MEKTATSLRLPQDVKAFIEAQAERNGSSQNSEIVRCIRNRMDETKTATSEPASSN